VSFQIRDNFKIIQELSRSAKYRPTLVVVITVVSLLFPESIVKWLLFWQCQKLLVTNYTFFVLMNEEKGWINFQKQIYTTFFGKISIFQKF